MKVCSMGRKGMFFSVGILLLVGCGSGETKSAIDQGFVASMLPHHRIGMELLNDGARRVNDVRVRNLIFQMASYHHREFAQLEEYQDRWGIAEATTFPGLPSAADWNLLNGAQDVEYDIIWLDVMIFHHRGAVNLARKQVQDGVDENLVDLATEVMREQRSQIKQMEKILTDICVGVDLGVCNRSVDLVQDSEKIDDVQG
jgi:uncharacterized protein (DUF305 family)